MKRFLVALLVILVSVSVVFASGTTEKEEGKITLRWSWWGGETRHKATIAAIERYMELNPNVVIEYEYMGFDSYYQKLLTQLAGGTQPEICSIDYKWIGDLVAQDKPFLNIYDLEEMDLSSMDVNFLANYCGVDGYLIGVPCGVNGRGAIYNTEFFEKYGIEPSDTWTWDDLLAAGEKVQAQDKDAHLLFLTNDVLMYVTRDIIKQKYGVNMITDDYQLVCTEEDLVECMDMIKKLMETGTMPPYEEYAAYETVFADQIPAWLEGRYGMTVLTASNLPSIIAASPFEIKTMAWVSGNAENSATTIAPTMMLGIPKNCKYPEEAAKFISWFMNSPEAQAITGDTRGIPATTTGQAVCEEKGLISPQVSSMLSQALAQGGTPENGITLNAELGAIISDYSHKVAYGVLTPEAAGKQLYDDLNYALVQLSKK